MDDEAHSSRRRVKKVINPNDNHQFGNNQTTFSHTSNLTKPPAINRDCTLNGMMDRGDVEAGKLFTPLRALAHSDFLDVGELTRWGVLRKTPQLRHGNGKDSFGLEAYLNAKGISSSKQDWDCVRITHGNPDRNLDISSTTGISRPKAKHEQGAYLNLIVTWCVTNGRSQRALARALDPNGDAPISQRVLQPYPCAGWIAESTEGRAVIGTPNGSEISYFSAQHKPELGSRHTRRIEAFAADTKASDMYEPSIAWEIEGVDMVPSRGDLELGKALENSLR
ncbi:hypothetical protein EK21DRAFT_117436 [Setomelanomma holmii]|uniref:Uncharacterized protein n=1 Tax=Setomelanomma holmii TaxID=210430 RepID=A0A9P4H018_9PLEO|nr:hypothetical protein EK21DRAFT_117436 [Setomelanomma holmii]